MPRKKTKEVEGNHKEKVNKKEVRVNLKITSIPKGLLESAKNGVEKKIEKECPVLAENQDDVFQAEAIQKVRLRKGQIEYFVKWAGVSECTWEPKKNILDSRLIENFKEQNLKPKKRRGRPPVPKTIKANEKNGGSPKMKEKATSGIKRKKTYMSTSTGGIKRKKTDARPEKTHVEKKKRGRPPVVKESSKPLKNSKSKAVIESNMVQDYPKHNQQMKSSHPDSNMDTTELDKVNNMELKKVGSSKQDKEVGSSAMDNEVSSSAMDTEVGSSELEKEVGSSEQDNEDDSSAFGGMIDSPKHAIEMNNSENYNEMDYSESSYAVLESNIPEPSTSPTTSYSNAGNLSVNSQPPSTLAANERVQYQIVYSLGGVRPRDDGSIPGVGYFSPDDGIFGDSLLVEDTFDYT